VRSGVRGMVAAIEEEEDDRTGGDSGVVDLADGGTQAMRVGSNKSTSPGGGAVSM